MEDTFYPLQFAAGMRVVSLDDSEGFTPGKDYAVLSMQYVLYDGDSDDSDTWVLLANDAGKMEWYSLDGFLLAQ